MHASKNVVRVEPLVRSARRTAALGPRLPSAQQFPTPHLSRRPMQDDRGGVNIGPKEPPLSHMHTYECNSIEVPFKSSNNPRRTLQVTSAHLLRPTQGAATGGLLGRMGCLALSWRASCCILSVCRSATSGIGLIAGAAGPPRQRRLDHVVGGRNIGEESPVRHGAA